MKDGIFLHDYLHVETDSFGNQDEEQVKVGLVNFGSEGKRHYSFDEVKEMIESGELKDDNIKINEKGEVQLRGHYLTYCKAFNVVCGRPINVKNEEDSKKIIEYGRKIGIIHDDFVPMEGWFGTKEVKEDLIIVDYNEEEPEKTFTITYTFKNKELDDNFAEDICIGAIKKLAGHRVTVHRGEPEPDIEKIFECSDVWFNKEEKKLIISGVKAQWMTKHIEFAIKNLDLELWMLFNPNKLWNRFFYAATQAVRDRNQEHWFNDLIQPKSETKRNTEWKDKKLGKTWEGKE